MLTNFHPLKAAVFAGAALLGIAASAASAATVTVDMQFFTGNGNGAKKDAVWTLGFSYDDSTTKDRQLSFADLISFTLSVASGRTLTLSDVVGVPGAIFSYNTTDSTFHDLDPAKGPKGQKLWLSVNASTGGGGMLLTHQGGSWHLTDFSGNKNLKLTANKLAENTSTTVTPSPVPLPIPGLLLLAGLGGLAALRPRRGQRAALAA